MARAMSSHAVINYVYNWIALRGKLLFQTVFLKPSENSVIQHLPIYMRRHSTTNLKYCFNVGFRLFAIFYFLEDNVS